MLYELWRKVAADRRGQLALREAASGRQWTFTDLLAASDAVRAGGSKLIFAQGHAAEFILAVLTAWRTGKIACPVERGQTPPVTPAAELPRDIVHLKTTSATTGTARLVAFTAEQLAADAENIVATMGLRPDWPNLGVISMAHSYGFSNLVLPLLLHGVPLILAPSPLPEAVRRAAEGERALTLPAVPAMWRAWHDADSIPANVRLAISAGAPLPLALEQEAFATRGLKLHNFYGATECGGIAYDAGEAPRSDDACIGAPMRNVNLSVGEDGCLVVQSRAAGQTYWPEPTEALGGGRFQTSDLVELRDDLVLLRGRASDLINVAGRKVSPETIEQALRGHPRVRECLVFGAPSQDASRTETIVTVVAAEVEDETELKNFLQQKIPAWQLPREWRFVESLNANERGKISRAEWRRRYMEKS